MHKRLLIALILLSGALAGLYQWRIQLIKSALNAALEESGITLVRLQGLEVGWNGLEIGELSLTVGESKAPQLLQQVTLDYRLIDILPQRLTVAQALLTMPETSNSLADSQASAPLLFAELVDQLMKGPLESVDISALRIDGIPIPLFEQPMQVRVSWEKQRLSLEARDRQNQLNLQLHRTGPEQLQLNSRLARDDQPIIELAATISRQGEQQEIQGEGRVTIAAIMPLLSPLRELPPIVASASDELLFTMKGLVDDDLTQPILRGAGLAFELNEPSLSARGELTALNCEYADSLHCDSLMTIQLSVPELTINAGDAITATGLKLQLSSKMVLDNNKLTATLAAGELARAESLVQSDISTSQPVLMSAGAGAVEYHLDSGEWHLQMDQLALSLPRTEMPTVNMATRVKLSDLEVFQNADKPLGGRVQLSADSINLQSADGWVPSLSLEADARLDPGLVSIEGKIHSDTRTPLFQISADYQLQTERGSGRILTDNIAFNASDKRLSQYFSHWPFEWDIYQGNILLDASLTWRSGEQGVEVQGKIIQHLENIAGVYEDIGFIGLAGDFEAEFSSPDHLFTPHAASLSLDTLEIGVPVEHIQARFKIDTSRHELSLQTASAQLFGGRVWTDNAVYRHDRTHNKIDIGIDGLQLDQLLALAGYDAVTGTGRVSGLLPLDVSATGVIMERGMLAAKAPGGVMRYQAEVTPGTNPSMLQVIEALRNYHYNIFQVEADYLENGDLVLEMLLRGNNPDYDHGRPIHLNLNLTDNIPVLLRSLQSGRVIADSIRKKL
jgi:hypothetical protein